MCSQRVALVLMIVNPCFALPLGAASGCCFCMLILGTEAPSIMPNSVDLSFLVLAVKLL